MGVRLAPGEVEPGTDGTEPPRGHRQIQWGRREAVPAGDLAPRQMISLMTNDPEAPIQGYIVSCSRNIINPAGLIQPAYRIIAGVGSLVWEWPNLAPGTYVLYAQSLYVRMNGQAGGAVDAQAWAGRTEATPTLVLP